MSQEVTTLAEPYALGSVSLSPKMLKTIIAFLPWANKFKKSPVHLKIARKSFKIHFFSSLFMQI